MSTFRIVVHDGRKAYTVTKRAWTEEDAHAMAIAQQGHRAGKSRIVRSRVVG